MTKIVAEEEAYLLGSLFGRGSIEIDRQGNYQLILRIPFKEYSPIMVEMVKALERESKGMTTEQLLNLPIIQANNVRNIGLLLNRLKSWHPPRKTASSPLLIKVRNKWKLNDSSLAKEFYRWQTLYLEREKAGMEFVLRHLQETATFLATDPSYEESVSAFGVLNHIIRCNITEKTFLDLKSLYNLEEGDIYRHCRLPKSLFRLSKQAQYDFVRGLADTIATIDVWLIPRVQFSVINSNYGFAVDICTLLQTKLQVPVYYIGWAGSYSKRGGRDHLVKVWITNFDRDKFEWPLFYNQRKHAEFLEHLEIGKKQLAEVGRRHMPHWLNFCPFDRKKTGYMYTCMKNGCPRPARFLGLR
ncbi:MAG: hypothetical protein QXX19_03435 [Candidatus Caldarchaeum sp.]